MRLVVALIIASSLRHPYSFSIFHLLKASISLAVKPVISAHWLSRLSRSSSRVSAVAAESIPEGISVSALPLATSVCKLGKPARIPGRSCEEEIGRSWVQRGSEFKSTVALPLRFISGPIGNASCLGVARLRGMSNVRMFEGLNPENPRALLRMLFPTACLTLHLFQYFHTSRHSLPVLHTCSRLCEMSSSLSALVARKLWSKMSSIWL